METERGNGRKWGESVREWERVRESERERDASAQFFAQQLNTTQFCRKTLECSTFCRKTLKDGIMYALWYHHVLLVLIFYFIV